MAGVQPPPVISVWVQDLANIPVPCSTLAMHEQPTNEPATCSVCQVDREQSHSPTAICRQRRSPAPGSNSPRHLRQQRLDEGT
eukprot:scaffold450556_cov47-Prasinocladus_malaysianus.AAC.1